MPRGAEGGGKWHLFRGDISGCAQNQITEEIQEIRSLVNEDVRMRLGGMCEMYRVDIRGLMLNAKSHAKVWGGIWGMLLV